MSGMPENDFGRALERSTRSQDTSMSTKDAAAENAAATTDEPTSEQRTLDLDAARAVSIDGATLIECDAYTRTDDGHALRFDGSEPLFVVGIYSERDARAQLAAAGYAHAAIERAFRLGDWMEDDRPERATDAIRAAEHDEARMMADGGQSDDDRCEECGRRTELPDDHDERELHTADCSHLGGTVDPYADEREEVNTTPL